MDTISDVGEFGQQPDSQAEERTSKKRDLHEHLSGDAENNEENGEPSDRANKTKRPRYDKEPETITVAYNPHTGARLVLQPKKKGVKSGNENHREAESLTADKPPTSRPKVVLQPEKMGIKFLFNLGDVLEQCGVSNGAEAVKNLEVFEFKDVTLVCEGKSWSRKTKALGLPFEVLGPIQEARVGDDSTLIIDGEAYRRGHKDGKFKEGWVRDTAPKYNNHAGIHYLSIRCVFSLGPRLKSSKKNGKIPGNILKGNVDYLAEKEELFIGSKRPFQIGDVDYFEYDLLIPQFY